MIRRRPRRGSISAAVRAAALPRVELEWFEFDVQLPPPCAAEGSDTPIPRSAHADGAAIRLLDHHAA